MSDVEHISRRLKTHLPIEQAEEWLVVDWFKGRTALDLIADGFADRVHHALDVLFGVVR